MFGGGGDSRKTALVQESVSSTERFTAAMFYGTASLAVIFINKIVLSEYKFPNFLFLAGCQFAFTCTVLLLLHMMKKVEVPRVSFAILKDVSLISFMFFANVVTGLGSTKALNLPMFTALRRFSILMTMIGESYILGKEPSNQVVLSVGLMVGGAFVAALYDLTFDMAGYALVLANDLFTALNGIYLKRATLNTRFSQMGILFYNSLISLICVIIIYVVEHFYWHPIMDSFNSFGSGSLEISPNDATLDLVGSGSGSVLSYWDNVVAFGGWQQGDFITLFLLATCMGSILNYSTFLCTSVNSPLTTTVIGCLKNVLTTYVGMVFMGGYEFTWINFIGLNLSVLGSVHYTYVSLYKGPSVTKSYLHSSYAFSMDGDSKNDNKA